MKVKLESIAFAVFVGLAIIGTVAISIIFHELSHYQDLHPFVVKDDICVLNVPTTFDAILVGNAGWYSYYFNNSNYTIRDAVADTEVYTEGKAYTVSFVIMVIFMILLIVIIKKRVDNAAKAEIFDQITKELDAENPKELNSLSG